jgi:hypothetical protein
METTPLVVFTLFIILGLYDGFVVFYKGRGSYIGESVSRCLQRTGFKSPLFVFMMGAIMSHLFWYMSPECDCSSAPKTEEIDK